MRIHTDERRHFIADLFPTPGDVNVVRLYGCKPICWHRHQKQDDYLFVVQGVVKVGVIAPNQSPGTVDWMILSERTEDVMHIPANHWHGYMALGGEAILLSYITQKYNPSDEQRTSFAIPWD